MAVEELAERVGERVSRRRLLGSVGAAFLGATYTILGLPQKAYALVCYRCCCLCHSPSSNCCGLQVPFCIWSWTCCHANGYKYRCSEYYCGTGDCDADCSGVTCSKVTNIGSCSAANPCC
jgi:hypothetical protein